MVEQPPQQPQLTVNDLFSTIGRMKVERDQLLAACEHLAKELEKAHALLKEKQATPPPPIVEVVPDNGSQPSLPLEAQE